MSFGKYFLLYCIALLFSFSFLFPFALLCSLIGCMMLWCRRIIGRSIKAESFKNTVCQRSRSSLLVRTWTGSELLDFSSGRRPNWCLTNMLWLKLSSSHSLRIQHTLWNRAKGCPALLVCVNLFWFCFLVRQLGKLIVFYFIMWLGYLISTFLF